MIVTVVVVCLVPTGRRRWERSQAEGGEKTSAGSTSSSSFPRQEQSTQIMNDIIAKDYCSEENSLL